MRSFFGGTTGRKFRNLARPRVLLSEYALSINRADFGVESITMWWQCVGKHTFPRATKLLITGDWGGSKGYKNKVWKFRLGQLAARSSVSRNASIAQASPRL
ncbi:MAG: hypothetical protein LBG24_01130 [Treponema sp.]|nr:hypothetical protein [Treponema sp.]